MGSLTAFFLIIAVIDASLFLFFCGPSNISSPSVVHFTATYYGHYNFLNYVLLATRFVHQTHLGTESGRSALETRQSCGARVMIGRRRRRSDGMTVTR